MDAAAKPKPTYPRGVVIYYIHTPNSTWLGKGVEFFDDEAQARKRGRETHGTSRPFYPPYDRQYLSAAQGYAAPVPLKAAAQGFLVGIVEEQAPP